MSGTGRYFVYIMASGKNGTVYTGVTGNLIARSHIHRNDLLESFTRRHGVHDLVYFEQHDDPLEAIAREKRIKKWYRAWRVRLIEEANPQWLDRYHELAGWLERPMPTKNGFPPARE